MSNTMFRRAAPAAFLAMISTPAWSQSFHHAPAVDPGRGTSVMSMPSWLDTSSRSVSWSSGMDLSNATGWTPMPASYALPPGSLPSSSSYGPRPLPSRLHSSAFVQKRPTYRANPQTRTPTPYPALETPQANTTPHASPQAMPMVQTPYGPRPAPPAMMPASGSGSMPPTSYAATSPPSVPPTYPSPNLPVSSVPAVAGHRQAAPQHAAAPSPHMQYTSTAAPTSTAMRSEPSLRPAPSAPPAAPQVDVNRARGMAADAMGRGDFAAAEALLATAWGQQPGDASLGAMLAQTREAGGDWAGAVAVYDTLTDVEPSNRRWRALRAECHYQTGQYDLAVADYRAAAVAIRLSYDEFARFGDAALRIGDYKTAERALTALSQGSEKPVPQVELLKGITLLRQGNTHEARNVLLRASGRWPDDKTITEALRIASAAHYGDRPLPDMDDRRDRDEERKIVERVFIERDVEPRQSVSTTVNEPASARPLVDDDPFQDEPSRDEPISAGPTPSEPIPSAPTPAVPQAQAPVGDTLQSNSTSTVVSPMPSVVEPAASWRATRASSTARPSASTPTEVESASESKSWPATQQVSGKVDATIDHEPSAVIAASAEVEQPADAAQPAEVDVFAEIRGSTVAKSVAPAPSETKTASAAPAGKTWKASRQQP